MNFNQNLITFHKIYTLYYIHFNRITFSVQVTILYHFFVKECLLLQTKVQESSVNQGLSEKVKENFALKQATKVQREKEA